MGNTEGKGVLSRMAGILRVSPRVNEKLPWSSPRGNLEELIKEEGQVIIDIILADGKHVELKFRNFGEDVSDEKVKTKMKEEWLRPVNGEEWWTVQKQIVNNKPLGFSMLAYGYTKKRSTEDGGYDCTFTLDGLTGQVDAIENRKAQNGLGRWNRGWIFVFAVQQPNTETLRPAA